MKHTVVSKSGWQGDYWRVRRTLNNKAEAEQFANEIKTADVTRDGYHVQIKAHRKSLTQLMSMAYGDAVKFSDGTIAVA